MDKNDVDIKAKQIAKWLCQGNIGNSSLTMLCCSLGEKYNSCSPPADPADFNRCLELLKICQFVRDSFQEISNISKKWHIIISNWEKIEDCFIQEVGSNWELKGEKATKTYELMKKLTE